MLREGKYTDIVEFNIETINDPGNSLKQRVYLKGKEYLVVNGEIVIKMAKHIRITN